MYFLICFIFWYHTTSTSTCFIFWYHTTSASRIDRYHPTLSRPNEKGTVRVSLKKFLYPTPSMPKGQALASKFPDAEGLNSVENKIVITCEHYTAKVSGIIGFTTKSENYHKNSDGEKITPTLISAPATGKPWAKMRSHTLHMLCKTFEISEKRKILIYIIYIYILYIIYVICNYRASSIYTCQVYNYCLLRQGVTLYTCT